MLAEAEGRGGRGAAGVRESHELERRDHRRLERGDTVDALAQVEREIELCLSDALHPSSVRVDRNPYGLVAVLGEHLLDRLDRLEDQHVGCFAERRGAVEENRDFHAAPRAANRTALRSGIPWR